jgi:3-methyladenine DNA glycosylase/8-oxoguanine DNA glycosylase
LSSLNVIEICDQVGSTRKRKRTNTHARRETKKRREDEAPERERERESEHRKRRGEKKAPFRSIVSRVLWRSGYTAGGLLGAARDEFSTSSHAVRSKLFHLF